MFDLLILMAHKQSYVTEMLNKCRYSSLIAVFDNRHVRCQVVSTLHIEDHDTTR